MTDTTNNLSDLIEISEDGTAFYEEAAQKVKDKKLSSLFAKLAKVKSDLVTELSGEVKAPAKAEFRLAIRDFYLTNAIARASALMGELSAMAAERAKPALAAE